MIEVEIESIRISLVTQHRIVLLKEIDGDRQLPIWVGPCEADAITIELQDVKVERPLTPDLLVTAIDQLGGSISHILIRELKDNVFYASLFVDVNSKLTEIDCRPSDAIALAVRAKAPIFMKDEVLEAAGVQPEPDIIQDMVEDDEPDVESLDAFSDFLSTLDLDDLEGDK